MSNMSERNQRGVLWLAPLLGDDPARDGNRTPATNPKGANYGLVVSYADKHQGTYMVRNKAGAQWLVAKGADAILDIITRPADRIATEPRDERIIAAVKGFIKRNERQD
jgi:hypothetical protein